MRCCWACACVCVTVCPQALPLGSDGLGLRSGCDELSELRRESLVKAMQLAKQGGDPAAAQLVACECVVHAETKDHANWELLGKVAEVATGDLGRALKAAHEAVEKDEDHHLYHTKGWCRELAIEALGLPAVLPPPEEVKNVETAIGASRAEQQRERML